MSIEIKTNKVVCSDGVLSREITGFKGLDYKDLPRLYKDSKAEIVIICKEKLTLRNVEGKHWEEYTRKEIIPEENFQEIIEHCKKAGQHLKACNAELKDKKAQWHGPETFII